MGHFWYYILLIGGPIGVIAGYISFGEYIARFFKWIFKKKKIEEKIFVQILDWFTYIDKNLTEKGLNLEELNYIEKEIDFLFNIHKYSRLPLNFSMKFIDKYLGFCGLKKKYRTKENFIKYAHIKHENLELILGLDSYIMKSKITEFNMPFNTFWTVLRGNFYSFYGQYLNNWNGIPDEKKLFYSDIEMPIKLLRIYFNLDKKVE